MGNCNRWTEAQTEILRREYKSDKSTIRQLAKKLDKTAIAIQRKALRLGITNRKIGRRWSQEELEILEQASFKPIGEIELEINNLCARKKWTGRSRQSIISQINRMGLSCRVDGEYFTIPQIAQLIGCSARNVAYWLELEEFKQVLQPKKITEGVETSPYLIHWKNLKTFIISYPSVIDRYKPSVTWLVPFLVGVSSGVINYIDFKNGEKKAS